MFLLRLFPSGLAGSLRRIAAFCCVAAVLLGPSASLGHEGHDHDDAAAAALAASTFPRVAAQSELYEVVGVLKGGRLAVYLNNFTTNEPVTDAKVTVAIGDSEPAEAEPAQDGSYTASSQRLSGTGSVDVVFTISADAGDDLLIGSLALPAASGSVEAPASTALATSSRWLASFPAPIRNPVLLAVVSFGLGVLFAHLLRAGRVVPAIATGAASALVLVVLAAVAFSADDQRRADEVRGGKAAPPKGALAMSDAPRRLADGTAFVAKPTQRLLDVRTVSARPETVTPAVKLIGRVIGDPSRTSVVQSIHGGRVIPLESGIPRIGQFVRKGDVLAHVDPYLPLADRTTISERSGEIEQLIALAESKLRRLRPLVERGAVPQSQVTDLETELEGLRLRRETIRNTRTEPELLRAPTDGVIAVAKAVPGQVIQPQDILFQIVDPKGFWVEALAYGDVDPYSLTDASAAATGGQSMTLAFKGLSRALQQHAAVVHFAIAEPPPNLAIGQPVTVLAKSGAPVTGLVVPYDAVGRSANGESVVWLHVEPERFEARPVRTKPVDATRLVLADGVAEGERIVVRGADLVSQVR